MSAAGPHQSVAFTSLADYQEGADVRLHHSLLALVHPGTVWLVHRRLWTRQACPRRCRGYHPEQRTNAGAGGAAATAVWPRPSPVRAVLELASPHAARGFRYLTSQRAASAHGNPDCSASDS